MTPEIKQLNDNLVKTETIQGLKDGQEKIITIIEDERDYNKAEFQRGANKFAELDERMDEMSTQIAKGFKKQEDNFNKYISEGKDNDIKKLNEKLQGRQILERGVLITLIGGILLYVAVGIIKKSIVPEKEIVYIQKTQVK